MKAPEKYQRKIDELDLRIVRLFEQRMCLMKKTAQYYNQHDLERSEMRKRKPLPIVEKTASLACETKVIAYTEGLLIFMLTAAEKFYKQCLK